MELQHNPLANWHGVMGVQLQNRDFSVTDEEAFLPLTNSHSVGLFMIEKRHWKQWQFEVGGRIEHATQNPQGTALQSRDLISTASLPAAHGNLPTATNST